MIEINKNKLIPGVDTSWGDIRGDISKQSDLMSMMSSYATEEWVSDKNYLTASSLKTINNQSIVGSGNINIEASIPDYYATKQWVSDQGYLTSETLPSDLATESWVSSQGYITSEALSGFATESWVSSQGYLTSVPSEYATQSWVSGQGYLLSTSLKTINEQSLVGEGDIEIGGLTPEQEAAIELLTEPSQGILYTDEIPARTAYYKEEPVVYADYRDYIYNVDGEVYYNVYGNELYKWNFDTLSFDKLFNYSGGYEPIWKDNSGRYYIGVQLQLNMTTGETTSVNMDAALYTYEQNLSNIFKGNNGIYLLTYDPQISQIFDEDTQKFVQYRIDFPQPLSVSPYDFAKGIFNYEGHLVYVDIRGDMYEFIEHDDYAEFVKLVTPYYDCIINDSIVNNYFIHKCDGNYYYLNYANHYKLESGHWVVNTIIRPNYSDMQYGQSGVDTEHYLIGYELFNMSNKVCLTNPGSNPYDLTFWTNPAKYVVDLKSSQTISGTKIFTGGIDAGTINVTAINSRGNGLTIGNTTDITNINGKSVNIDTDICSLKGHNIAITDQCFLNRTYYPYGPYYNVVDSNWYDTTVDYAFTTHTGRLFIRKDNEWGELVGSTFTPVSFTISSFYGRNVFKVVGNTFMVAPDSSIYIWDDTDTDWVQIVSESPTSYYLSIWPCGSTIRFASNYKLVENNGTWSLVQDDVVNWPGSGVGVVNGNDVYFFADTSIVYTYDEGTKVFTSIGGFMNDVQYNVFSFDNDVFFVFSNTVYVLDLNSGSDFIYTQTSIPCSGSNYFYGVCDNKLYTCYYHNLGYVYGMTESVPEVPVSNGTYVLKAVRTNSGVTYSWVEDEVAQAVQITNEILS